MSIVLDNNWWRYTEKVRHTLYSCFFFFMPFVQALSFKIGFPLKFSELALLLLGFFFIVFQKKIYLPASITWIISILFFTVSLSVAINTIWPYDYPLREYASRFGYTGDSITRYVYFVMALLAFVISVEIFLTDTRRYGSIWVYGAVTAALYTWYLSIFSTLQWPYVLLPGMENPPQMIRGNIVRCGTFPEGNSMGLFFLVSCAIALYVRRYLAGVFLLLSIIPTFSTLAILSLLVFLTIILHKHIFRPATIFMLCLLMIPIGYYVSKTDTYKVYIHDKLFSGSMKITSEGSYSKVDRLISFKNSYAMGADNPFFGVGLSNYSRHYDHYLQRQELDPATLNTFKRTNAKTIPNNIFGEIWAESGGIALLLFLILLGQLLFYSFYEKQRILLGLLVCMLICFNAYPSFIMIYLWAAMALPVAHFINHKHQSLHY